MSDKFGLEDAFSQGEETSDQGKKPGKKKKEKDGGEPPKGKTSKPKGRGDIAIDLDWGEVVEGQETVNYTMNIYPFYRNIIQGLAHHSRKSQREVLEIIIREYFKGREKKLLEVLEEWEKKKNTDEDEDFLI